MLLDHVCGYVGLDSARVTSDELHCKATDTDVTLSTLRQASSTVYMYPNYIEFVISEQVVYVWMCKVAIIWNNMQTANKNMQAIAIVMI